MSAPPRPAAQPNARGPLPYDAGQAGGARSAAAVVEPAPPVPPPQEDEEMDEGGEDGEDGEGDLECTCAKRYCECPWYVDMSKQEQRNHKQKLRNKRRDEKQVCTDSPSNLTAEP